MKSRAFTLIELLVVVLIIGILAAIALPQYQKAVEKSRMTEAVMMVRKIAQLQQVYFLANGEYATLENISALGINIPHTSTVLVVDQNRLVTRDFAYTCKGTSATQIAVAERMPAQERYYIWVNATTPDRIRCNAYNSASAVQKKLCEQLNKTGNL